MHQALHLFLPDLFNIATGKRTQAPDALTQHSNEHENKHQHQQKQENQIHNHHTITIQQLSHRQQMFYYSRECSTTQVDL